MNRLSHSVMGVFLLVLFGTSLSHAQLHKGISFQGVIKLPTGEYPNRTGLTVNGRILSPNDCILREEQYSGLNITNGYVNISIGTGTTGGYDPGFTMKQIMDNSKVITGLTCLNLDGSVNSGVTTFNPATTNGARKFRLSVMIDSFPVVADFNMRAMAFAINSESLNGKTDSDFVNTSTNITQTAVESWFASSVMSQLLAGTFVAPSATTAGNVSGTVAVANGGTGATSASGALNNLLPAQGGNAGRYLTTDGSNATWSVIPSAPVTSVAGRTGDVLLTSADISDFSTAADARITAQKGVADGLATLDSNGKVPSSQLALTAADIPSLDASKITTGTIDPSLLPASAGLWQSGASNAIYYNSGNIGIGTNAPGAKVDIYGGMFTVRSGTLTPTSNITGGVITSVGTDAAPGYFRSASWTGLPNSGQSLGGYRFGTGTSGDTAKIEAITTEKHNAGKGTAIQFFTTPNGANSKIESVRIDSGGNVGIGVTSPAAKLEVAGQVKITGGTPGSGKVLTSDADGLASWVDLPAGNAGSVTGVTSANSYITVTDNSAAPVITANVGTTANTLAAGDDARFTDSRAPTGTASGDLSGNYPNPTVAKINGNAVASTTPNDGQVMVWSSGQYAPANFGVSNLLSSTGAQQFANASCTASQTLTWSSLSDTFTCSNIAGLDAGVITSGTIDAARLPTSATAWVDGGAGALYYNGGNVGIGTTNPNTKLHVENSDSYLSGAGTVGTTSGSGIVTGVGTTFTQDFKVGDVILFGSSATNLNRRVVAQVISDTQLKTNSVYESSTSSGSMYFRVRPSVVVNSSTQGFVPFVVGESGTQIHMRSSPSAKGNHGLLAVSDVTDISGGQVQSQVNSFINTTGTYYSSALGGTISPSIGTGITNSGYARGLNIAATRNSNLNDNGSLSNLTGVYTGFGHYNRDSSTPTTDAVYGYYSAPYAYSGTIKKMYDVYLGAATGFPSSVISDGVPGNVDHYALYQADTATPNYFAGNIGLGVVNPSAKLEVAGQVKITGGNPGAGKVLTSDADGLATWSDLPVGSSGTVTGVTSANSFITVTDNSAAPVITANVGTTANTLAAGDDSRFTNSRTPTGSAGGDLSGTYPNPTVAKINGNAVASTTPTAGQVMVWSSGQYAPANFGIGNLLSSTGAQQFANSACTAAQTLTWSSLTDTFTCSNIAGLDASVITGGTIAAARLPTSATAWVDGGSGALYYNGGNVGIGTDSPQQVLHVESTSGAAMLFKSTGADAAVFVDAATGSSANYQLKINGTQKWVMSNDSLDSDKLKIATTKNGNMLTMTSAGSVGIGTVSPLEKLQVNGNIFVNQSAGDSGIRLQNAGGTSYWINTPSTTMMSIGGYGATVPTSGAINITNSNVGIGTTSPQGKLDVNGSAVLRSNAAGSATWVLSNVSMGGAGGLIHTQIAPESAISTQSGFKEYTTGTGSSGVYHLGYISNLTTPDSVTDRFVIAASGNVGIGAGSPTATLEINAPTTTAAVNQLKVTDGTTGGYWALQEGTSMANSYAPVQEFRSVGVNGVGGIFIGRVPDANDIVSGATSGAMIIDGRTSSDTTLASSNVLAVRNKTTPLLTVGYAGDMTLQNANNLVLKAVAAQINDPGDLIWQNYDSTERGRIHTNTAATPFMTFSVGGNSSMYILANGNVGVGNNSPTYKLDVQGDINASGVVRSAGTALTSDIRFKRNIAAIENPLDKVLSLRGVTYDWRQDEFPERQFSDKHQLGVIAQEVEKQFPEAVYTDDKGYKSVNYSSLVAPLIESVRALYSRIVGIEEKKADKAEVDAKVQKLEQENAALKERLERIEKLLEEKNK